VTPEAATRRVARALDALRHGWAIRVTDESDGGARFDLLPAETGFAQPGLYAAQMLISAARAATLKLANQLDAAVPERPVLLHGAEPFTLAQARDLADPARDLDSPCAARSAPARLPPPGRARSHGTGAPGRHPARLSGGERGGRGPDRLGRDLEQFKDPLNLTIQARARLPVEACEKAEIVAFRARDDCASMSP
jgi:GTP cyclohydrolase II